MKTIPIMSAITLYRYQKGCDSSCQYLTSRLEKHSSKLYNLKYLLKVEHTINNELHKGILSYVSVCSKG